MNSLKPIQTLSKIGNILSKIAFVFSVIGFCGCIAGLLSLSFGNGSLIKIGGVTLHGLISENFGYNIKAVSAALSGWLVICAGEAVIAKFAELYFRNELKAGDPFTFAGAKEMMRLGILTIAVSVGSSVIGGIVEGIVVGFLKIEKTAVVNMYSDSAANIALGVMFIVVSLLCRYGAELRESGKTE